ncbi:CaiB/BaiF CoA-transferase family protein [Comamonas sp. 26]|uniref:CaiB/BaiF CoA transferase family protein n=1 Tax=Comamonas sp. 26 TaxID=2035201 RepID=UPI000C19E831|nr:CoA transferase [Comamonas sp. 26]PIG09011.1 CoA:oxalate CoA-transferase [Comamonas sp. 26]
MSISAENSVSRPLDGIRILDFTRVLAGPMSTALLADLGAEVVKVEPPQGDDYRAIGPMKNGQSALFTVMNRNKQSLVLDLKNPQAAEIVQQLAQKVDVVVENFRPGVAERLGIGPEKLRSLNPKLVYVSVSGFGQTGPLAHRPAYDIIVQAMSGLMEATGEPDGAPTLVGEAVSDVVAGLFASWATLAALLQAQRTGQGQHVDVAMFDTTLTFLATSVSRYLFTGQPARRVGNRHPLSAPFGVYKARDGHFALAVLNKKLFDATVLAMELPQLVDDPRFATDETRSAHEPELRSTLEGWSCRHGVADVVAALDAAGVPVAPIWNIEQALESPQIHARGLLREVEDERLPGMRLPTQPVHFKGSAPNRTERAPALGEHTELLLSSWLGRSQEAIAALRNAGALGATDVVQAESH